MGSFFCVGIELLQDLLSRAAFASFALKKALSVVRMQEAYIKRGEVLLDLL